ncbi:MAG: NRDE family protein [Bacteroidetes bacterium]|nr:MAG: NRDE family protein [Bacteroidota bacterium]
MCLILLAYRTHPDYSLVVAANRDEFYHRPAKPSTWWGADLQVLSGIDLKAGGTWMGVTRQGRFAALTNVREPHRINPQAPSRGQLVADFLTGTEPPEVYLHRLEAEAQAYNGFNLLVGDASDLWYYGNRTQSIMHLQPGIYGLSNAALNTPWPKVEKGMQVMRSWAKSRASDPGALFRYLGEKREAPDQQLPDTGVPLEWERKLSSAFIHMPERAYGTRLTTVLTFSYAGEVHWEERSFFPPLAPRTYDFSLPSSLSV